MRAKGTTGILALVVLACVVTLFTFFVAIPFYSDRADRRQAAAQQVVDQRQQQVRTEQFLHMFDCTYGDGLRVILRLDVKREQQAQQMARSALRINLEQHQFGRARLNRQSIRQAEQREATYRARLRNVPRLGNPRPCNDVIAALPLHIPPNKK